MQHIHVALLLPPMCRGFSLMPPGLHFACNASAHHRATRTHSFCPASSLQVLHASMQLASSMHQHVLFFMPIGLNSVTQRILSSHGPYLQQLRRARQACPAPRCAELSCRTPFFHIHHPLNTSQCLLANQTLCTSLLSMTEETSRTIRSIPAAQKGPPALPCVPLCCACQQQRSLSSTSVGHTTMSPGVLWLLLS